MRGEGYQGRDETVALTNVSETPNGPANADWQRRFRARDRKITKGWEGRGGEGRGEGGHRGLDGAKTDIVFCGKLQVGAVIIPRDISLDNELA